MHSHLKPVAVCGIALRLPGGINNAGDLWDALQSKRDMRTPVPESRYCKEGFSNVHGSKSAIETQDGYFLDQDLACFDSSLFSLTEEEVKRADPQQRILLELVKECLENAGEINYRGRDIGCYVGTFGEDWLQSQSKEDQHSGGYIMSGQIDLMLANRVSYENDLRGPSMVIKTGCSASLIALHEACRAIQMNDCDGAIVAGTNLILGPSTTIAMTSEGILSPEGSCKTFDSAADGFARGEAITAIYVQDLDKAIEQGLPIRAVIPNTGVNCDGRSRSILQPSLEAQVALMRKVYGDLGLDPARTAYVECHGTGTPTGDPIEAAAVGQVFGRKGVYIGSIKPNIGHSEGASGISSLIKSVLMLEKGMIAPNIKFCSPNPKIAFEEHQLQVPDELLPWPRDRDMRVSINSFGIGGSNAHVIIEHPYTYLRHSSNSLGAQLDSPQLLLMSTSTPLSLQKLSASYEEYIQDRLASLPGLAYTLANRREHHRFRTFAVCSSNGKLHIAPSVKVSGQAAGITLVFSGQGAQWAQMGCDLLEFNTAFLQAIKAMDQILESLQHPPEWSVEAELRKPSETSRLDQAEIAQPLCTAVQIALLQVLYTGGVQPSAVVGHSSGEIAAAYAAGAICMEEAIIVAYYRGFIAKNYVVKGSMAAIGLDSKTTRQFLKPGVVVACKNSPSSTTISGDNDALESALEEIKRRLGDVFARKLKVDIAYHSHHMQKVSTKYLDLLQNELRSRNLCRNNPTVPIFSSVWDQKITSAQTLSPEYWVANLVSPVEFNRAVEKLLREHANNVLLEVGPHSSLAGPLRQTCSAVGAEYNYCATLKRYSHGTQDVLSTFGTLYQHGIDIDFSGVIPEGTLLTDLPTYPWNHSTSYWYECRLANAWRLRKFGHHELLGLRVFQSTSLNPTWRILLNIEDVPWLADHKVKCDIVFPFAAYVSMAGEALRQMSNIEGGYSIRDFAVVTAMVLDKEESLEIVTALHSGSWNNIELAENNFAFTISSYTGSTWIQHCRGVVGPPRAFELSLSNSDHTPRSIGSNTWYSSMARLGLEYGPSFQKIDHLATSTHEMLAFARLVGVADHQSLRFPLHPTTIDASFQVGIAALAMGLCRNFSRPMVPTYLEQLDVLQSTTSINCRAFYSAASGELSIDGVGTNGESCFRLRGMRFKELLNDHLASDEDQHGAARLEWVPHHESKEISNLIQIPSSGKREKEIVEELALLCVVESVELLKDLEPSMSHLLKYRAWLSLVAEQAFTDKHPVLERTSLLVCLPAEERTLKMRQLSEEASSSPLTASFTEALLKVRDNIQGLFVGNVDALELLLRNDNLARIYDAVSFDYSNFICSLCDAMPNLRILEIGAGTGGTTELILRGLQRNTKFPRYAKYTFTDISAGFFPSARQRFAGAANMEFKVFDISLDSSEQGFEPGSYDLILAANVIHATSNLAQTLGNLRPLLAGCGQLVLTEFCTRFQAPNYIYGNFSGWWLGEADDRKWEPYVDIARWDKELKAAGFSGASNTVLDAAEPWQYCATIVAHNPAKETKPSTTVSIIGENSHTTVNLTLVEGLEHEGLSPCFVALNDCSTLEGDVIVSLDLEMYFFEDISDERFGLFQKLCRTLKGKTVLWLMPPTQICCDEPRGSQRLGVIRTARYELNTPMSTLEIDVSAPGFSKFVAEVFYKVRSQEDCGTLDPDREFAVHEGNVKVGRYRPFHLRKEIERSVASRSIQARLLQNAQPLEKSVSKGRSSPNGVVVESAESSIAVSTGLRLQNHTKNLENFDSAAANEVRASIPNLKNMQCDDKIGKAAKLVQPDGPVIPFLPRRASLIFDSNATYMITGGLGGLGRAIAVWLSEHGVCNILFLSPSAGSKPTHHQLFAELESMGCTAIAVPGAVQNEADVRNSINAAKTPIKGVLHLAMQLRDAPIIDMAFEDWKAAIAPKVDGTWNLHQNLGDSLEFFVMFSSLSTVLYQPGQSNYNAANTFMEAFCQYRHGLGMSASVLNVCPIEGIGYVAENPSARRKLKSQGHWFLDERALLEFLELAILESDPAKPDDVIESSRISWENRGHIVLGLRSELPLDNPSNRATWKRDRRMGHYHNATDQRASQASSGGSRLTEFLVRLENQPDLLNEMSSKQYLAEEIGRKIFSFIMRSEEDMDVSLTLVQVGLDSLMAIEVRRWWNQSFGFEISVLEIMNSGTIAELGYLAAKGLNKKFVNCA